MALGPRLDLRQSQSLVMTPQLQQAIKLLALSNLEIETFIGDALESNPLLEAGQVTREVSAPAEPVADTATTADELIRAGAGEADSPLDIDVTALDRDRDTGDWSSQDFGQRSGEAPDLENRAGAAATLAEHLEPQIGPASPDPRTAAIARHIVGLLDDAGYLDADLREVAADLGVSRAEAEAGLALVQSLDPTGVGARSLSECLALQAKEADRYDPCMARLIDNLDLLARGEIQRLKRICDVDDEDMADMIRELRAYDPKPGCRFGGEPMQGVTPDIFVAKRGGGWAIEINAATLPRLLVNRAYYAEISSGPQDKGSKAWLSDMLASANWLVKALDQRQRTIIKVASEIVKQQEAFFLHGVAHLKPMTLRQVAEVIEMHESTVSRVTSNKYLSCARGLFELKYFFTSAIQSSDGGDAVSANAVKDAIRTLIGAEDPKKILSDDTLVELLNAKGFDIARRTVAKYREALGIGSSVQRRRQKALEGVG